MLVQSSYEPLLFILYLLLVLASYTLPLSLGSFACGQLTLYCFLVRKTILDLIPVLFSSRVKSDDDNNLKEKFFARLRGWSKE
jgi:hypothetical protein